MIEPVDIYDSRKQPTGKVVDRMDMVLGEGEFMLIVLALIEDAEGRLLVTQRSLDKRWGAGWWEVTGGGARAGETSRAAVKREVAEETGLTAVYAADVEPELVYSYCNDEGAGGDNYFVDIYRVRMDFSSDDISLQESEAIDFRILSWDEITKLHEQGIFLHYTRVARALGKVE